MPYCRCGRIKELYSIFKVSIETKRCNLRITPMDLDNFRRILFVWPFQVKFSSRVIPRKLKDVTCSMGVSFIISSKVGRDDYFRWEKWKSMNYVLETLIESLFTHSQL